MNSQAYQKQSFDNINKPKGNKRGILSSRDQANYSSLFSHEQQVPNIDPYINSHYRNANQTHMKDKRTEDRMTFMNPRQFEQHNKGYQQNKFNVSSLRMPVQAKFVDSFPPLQQQQFERRQGPRVIVQGGGNTGKIKRTHIPQHIYNYVPIYQNEQQSNQVDQNAYKVMFQEYKKVYQNYKIQNDKNKKLQQEINELRNKGQNSKKQFPKNKRIKIDTIGIKRLLTTNIQSLIKETINKRKDICLKRIQNQFQQFSDKINEKGIILTKNENNFLNKFYE